MSSFLFINSGVQHADAVLAHLGQDSDAVQLDAETDGPSRSVGALVNVTK